MYLCVRVRVRMCVWGRRSWEKRVKKEKWKWKWKEKRNEKNKETGEKRKHKLTHTDKHTDRQADRHKSFIDIRYYTEQYSKSNSIE